MDKRIRGRILSVHDTSEAKGFLGTFGYFANSLNDFENLNNTLYAALMEFSDKPKKQFFCAWIAIPGDTENAEKKKFLYFLPEFFVFPDTEEGTMDKRIKGRILTPADVKDAGQYAGSFGYFGNVTLDFEDLDIAFYGQLTETPLNSFYGTPDGTGNIAKFLMFVPEEFVADDVPEPPEEIIVPETEHQNLWDLQRQIDVLEERLTKLEKRLESN